MATNRWKKAAKDINRENMKTRNRKPSRPEWRSFDSRMVQLLQSIQENEESIDQDSEDGNKRELNTDGVDGAPEDGTTWTEKKFFDKLMDSCKQSDQFMIECLVVCLEVKRGQLKKYIKIAEKVLDDRHLDVRNVDEDHKFWEEVFYKLYDRAVIMEDSLALREALLEAHEGSPNSKMPSKPAINCPALVEACLKKNSRLVKLFIKNGYFLESEHFKPKSKEKAPIWADMPFWVKTQPVNHMDEVNEMIILRAMAEPCYLLTRYSVPSERKRLNRSDSEQRCACCFDDAIAREHRELKDFHYCPNHRKFAPQRLCTKHVECSDPVYRTFELVNIARKYADKVPEYREEYEEIAEYCSMLGVDLLDACKDTPEVERFLKVRTGAATYFSRGVAKTIQFPRVQMAVVDNQKEFVGHMYCQQVLRQQWHGYVDWIGRGFRFKALYYFFQMILTPWFAIQHITRTILKDLKVCQSSEGGRGCDTHHVSGADEPDSGSSGSSSSGGAEEDDKPNQVLAYFTGRCNLDEPINRFISFSGMYLVFASLIITCILRPITEPLQLTNNFHWYHDILVVYTLAMFLRDVYSVVSIRGFGAGTFRLWRIFDLLLEIILGVGFFTRLLMGKLYPCDHNECPPGYISQREPFDKVSNCLFAIASTMAVVRTTYWFQLHDQLGPLVIYFNKVIFDIFVFISFFIISMLGFALGLVPLAVSNVYAQKNDTNTSEAMDRGIDYLFTPELLEGEEGEKVLVEGYWQVFVDMMNLLFWTIFNPEKTEMFNTDETDGMFAMILFAAYCIITVIVLLNLLIAVMNASISRIQDQKHLYFKFTRTCLWAEYFDDHNALPMPFSVFTFLRDVIKHMVTGVTLLKKKYAKDEDKHDPEDKYSVPMERLDRGEGVVEAKIKRRKEQNDIMMTLIDRYWAEQKRKAEKMQPAARPQAAASTGYKWYESKDSSIAPAALSQSLDQPAPLPPSTQRRSIFSIRGKTERVVEEDEEELSDHHDSSMI